MRNTSRPASPGNGSTRRCASGSKIPSPGTTTAIPAARSRPTSRRGARGAAAAMLAHGVEEPGERPYRALHCLARLCDRGEWSLRRRKSFFADLIDAATAPELSYVYIWRNGTSSCGTTARPCIAVDHGPRTRRGLWCARRSPRPRRFAARGVCFSRSGCWPVVCADHGGTLH